MISIGIKMTSGSLRVGRFDHTRIQAVQTVRESLSRSMNDMRWGNPVLNVLLDLKDGRGVTREVQRWRSIRERILFATVTGEF